MQALTHHTHLTTSHIHSLICSIPRTMELPNASSSAFNPPLSAQNPPSPSNSSSNSARSTPSTLTDEKKSRKRKSATDLELPIKRKLAAEVPNFMRDRVVSAASLTEEMLKREKLEQSLREKTVNRDEDGEPTSTQKQQSICKVCGDVAFGKHYGVWSCNGCKSYFRRSVWFNRQYICRYEGNCLIEKGCRNVCRSCRLKQCFYAGMNPRAVQSERERFSSTQANKNQSTESVEASCQTEDLVESRSTKQMNTAWQQQLFDDELSRKAQALLTMHLNALNKVDTEHLLTTQRPTAEFHEVPFANAFFDPGQVSLRTPLNPLPLRQAVADDLIEDYLRCFILYSDYLMQWEDFRNFKYHDQVVLAQSHYSLFHWWIVSLWTADSNLNGICYSNGTYFERGSSVNQNGPQLELLVFLMDKLLDTVVKDIRLLQLTETERICLFAIAFFSNVEGIGLSEEGVEMAANCRELYIKVLYNYIVQQTAQIPIEQPNVIQILMRKQSDASLRSNKILLLASSLKTIIIQSPNEGRLGNNIISRVFTSTIPVDLKPVTIMPVQFTNGQ